MKVMGRHVLAEIHDCDMDVLNNLWQVESLVKDAVGEYGLSVNDCVFQQYSPQGISGVVIVPQSHMMIHTWPEGRCATVDVYTYSEAVDPWAACNSLVAKFGASHMTARASQREIEIGTLQEAV